MGSAITNVHKEIYKVSRHYLTDRVMAVRCAAAKVLLLTSAEIVHQLLRFLCFYVNRNNLFLQCLLEMLNHAPFLYTTEIESVATLCFRAFEGSNYEVRCSVAKLLGTLVAMTQIPSPKVKNLTGKFSNENIKIWHLSSLSSITSNILRVFLVAHNKGVKQTSLEDVLNILMSGFLRGGVGFLKGTGEIIKGSSGVNREVRVGVTHVSAYKYLQYIFKLNIYIYIYLSLTLTR